MNSSGFFNWDAFLCYSRKDSETAYWFWRDIEKRRVPRDLPHVEGADPMPRRVKLFMDTSDLGAGRNEDDIADNLRKSKFLLVLCSPNSARPNEEGRHYVDWEIRKFTEIHGSDYARTHIVPVVIIPDASSLFLRKQCLPPALLEMGVDILGQSIPILESPDKSSKSLLKTREEFECKALSRLLGVEFQMLYDRFQIEAHLRLIHWLIGAGCVALALVALSLWALLERTNAVRSETTARRTLAASDFQEADRRIEDRETGNALSYLASSIEASPGNAALTRFDELLRSRSWLVKLEPSPQSTISLGIPTGVSEYGDIRLYRKGDEKNGITLLTVLRDHPDHLSRVVIPSKDCFGAVLSRDGSTVATLSVSGEKRRCHLWNSRDGGSLGGFELPDDGDPVMLSATGTYTVIMSADKTTFRLVSMRNGKVVVNENLCPLHSWSGFVFSEDESVCAYAETRIPNSVSSDRNSMNMLKRSESTRFLIQLRDVATGTILGSVNGIDLLSGWALAPSGAALIYCTANGKKDGWTIVNKPLGDGIAGWTAKLPGEYPRVLFSPDGVNVAIQVRDGAKFKVFLYDVYGSGVPRLLCLCTTDKDLHAWAFSHDGRRLVVVQEGGALRLLNVRDGSEAVERRQLNTELYGIAFSRDDRALVLNTAVGMQRYAIQVSPLGPREIHPDTSGTSLVDAALCDGSSCFGFLLMRSGWTGVVEMHSLSGGEDTVVRGEKTGEILPVNTVEVAGYPNCLRFSPNGRMAVIGTGEAVNASARGKVFLFDIPQDLELFPGKWKERMAVDTDFSVTDVAFSPDGTLLLLRSDSAVQDTACKTLVYDVSQGKLLSYTIAHDSTVSNVAFSPDGGRIISVGVDRSLKTWDAATGRLLWSAKLDYFPDSIAVASDGRIASGMRLLHSNGCVAVHSPDGKLIWKSGILTDAVGKVAFDKKGELLAVAFIAGDVMIFDAATGRPRSQMLPGGGAISSVAFVSFGSDEVLCVGGRRGENRGYVDFWDPSTSRQVSDTVVHPGVVKGFAQIPSGELLSWSDAAIVSPSPFSDVIGTVQSGDYRLVAGLLSGRTLNEWRAFQEFDEKTTASVTDPRLTRILDWLMDTGPGRTVAPESSSKLEDQLHLMVKGSYSDCERVLDIRPDDVDAVATLWFHESCEIAESEYLQSFRGKSNEEILKRETELAVLSGNEKWALMEKNPEAMRLANFRTRDLCERFPDSVASWRERGTFLRLTGHLDEAKLTLRRAVDLDPSDIDTSIQLSLICQMEGDNAGMLDVLMKLSAAMESNSRGYVSDVCGVGKLLLRIWTFERGTIGLEAQVDALLSAIEKRAEVSLSIEDQEAMLLLAEQFTEVMLYAKNGPDIAHRLNAGLLSSFHASAIKPSKDRSSILLGLEAYCSLVQGNLADARRECEEAIGLNENPGHYLILAYLDDMSGNRSGAVRTIREMLSYDDKLAGGISRQLCTDFRLFRERGTPLACEADLRDDLLMRTMERAKTSCVVRQVLSGGQGARAGIKAGDRILRYDGYPVLDLDNFSIGRQMEKRSQSAEQRDVVLIRDGAEITVQVNPGLLGIVMTPGL